MRDVKRRIAKLERAVAGEKKVSDTAQPQPQPGDWQPTPRMRWFCHQVEIMVGVYDYNGPKLQQQWYIPNSEQYEWRDVPTVEEEQA